MQTPRIEYVPVFGKIFAAVWSLVTHSFEHNIEPDQYKYVDRPTNICSFEPITNQAFGLLLKQMMESVFQINGEDLSYNNVTTLDLTDDSNKAVDNRVWLSTEMNLTNIFDSEITTDPTIMGVPFGAYLFKWIFPKVTSVNLSHTKWSDYATALIIFSQIKQLIWWNSYITTASFLSPLLDCTNLVELQLDNSTFRLP